MCVCVDCPTTPHHNCVSLPPKLPTNKKSSFAFRVGMMDFFFFLFFCVFFYFYFHIIKPMMIFKRARFCLPCVCIAFPKKKNDSVGYSFGEDNKNRLTDTSDSHCVGDGSTPTKITRLCKKTALTVCVCGGGVEDG